MTLDPAEAEALRETLDEWSATIDETSSAADVRRDITFHDGGITIVISD